MGDILVPVSPGELIDKMTILRLKSERITDKVKLVNVAHEHSALEQVFNDQVSVDENLNGLWEQLYQINATLWQIEDDIRICERQGDFGDEFIRLARAVYVTNDQRAELKKQINLHLGSAITEEKSYEEHRAR